jgi:superfamily I DNA and/or RNA helicase
MPETHYDHLLDLLDLERREEIERFQAESAARPLAEREARGEAIARLRCVDEEIGLCDRFLVTLEKEEGLEIPFGAARPGEVVSIAPLRATEAIAPHRGIVARREARRITLAFDREPPEWLTDGRALLLERVADDATWRRLRAATERARDARGDRLAELRRIFDGERPLERALASGARCNASTAALLDHLDPSQKEAALFALETPDFALIHGPPGTGKTTAVIALIRAAIERGERVLACAPSNAAVDLLAERLVAAGVLAVRIGHSARISEAVLAASLDERVRAHADAALARSLFRDAREIRRRLARKSRTAFAREKRRALRAELFALEEDARRNAATAIEKVLDGAAVVCATLTGAEGPPLGERRFDLAVIDEAAQALEPACWIAVARARRLVLAGDHFQLPPTVISPEAAREGLSKTLFERLHARFGAERARLLSVHYRMHEAIADFPNRRFYEGALRAAPSNARHLLCDLPGVSPRDPWTSEPVLFFDTSGAGFQEERLAGSASVRNEGESELAARIVRELIAAGLPPAAIGVISPYSAQVAAIRERLCAEVAQGLEVDSADGFQGREREAIVLSLTRNNESGDLGFLADYRRANVALTRARRALFVVGDGATLARDSFYCDLFEWAGKRGALRSAWEIL